MPIRILKMPLFNIIVNISNTGTSDIKGLYMAYHIDKNHSIIVVK